MSPAQAVAERTELQRLRAELLTPSERRQLEKLTGAARQRFLQLRLARSRSRSSKKGINP